MKVQKFDKRYFSYLFPQRTRLKTEYALTAYSDQDSINQALTAMMIKDYDMIKEYVPSKAQSILDIGCGLGLIDLALYHHYQGSVNLHLLDKTNDISEDTSVRGFNEKYIFYNSMDATRKTLTDNGVQDSKLFTYEVGEASLENLRSQKFDMILSLLSCGWHYALETYIDLIKETLSDDGILIIDIRHNTGQLEYALNHFDLIQCIVNHAESKHTGGTIGDRYIFKKKN
ncbi:MAG: hypothetical protein EBU90_16810 [Proteobacteria bacterium]|nr:hypothetical protein [Pseudomonadota bacterium]